MAMQRVTIQLTELRCLDQSEGSGGSEPYIWATYFAFGAQQLPFQTGLIGTITPSFNAFRTEFADGLKAGQATSIPQMIASASFDMDLDAAPQPKMVGCVAVLMEQDSTPDSSIVLGQIAYSKEMEMQLTELATRRLQQGNFGPLTGSEIETIKTSVKRKVVAAIGSNQSIFDVFTDQDDPVGFTFKTFTHFASRPGESEIKFKFFDFPEIRNGTDRFVLSGGLFLGPVLKRSVDRCAAQRAALKALRERASSLHTQKASLQKQLQGAGPGSKPGLIASISRISEQIGEAETRLPALEAALEACQMIKTTGDASVKSAGVLIG